MLGLGTQQVQRTPPDQLLTLQSLIALIADPKGAQARLAALTEAEDDAIKAQALATAEIAKANEAIARAKAATSELEEKRIAAAGAETAAKSQLEALEAKTRARNDELAQRERAVTMREQSYGTMERQLQERITAFEQKAMTDRAAIKKQEDEASSRMAKADAMLRDAQRRAEAVRAAIAA